MNSLFIYNFRKNLRPSVLYYCFNNSKSYIYYLTCTSNYMSHLSLDNLLDTSNNYKDFNIRGGQCRRQKSLQRYPLPLP